MVRYLAGAAGCLLFIAGAFLLWHGHAETRGTLPSAPAASTASGASLFAASASLKAPEASPQSREERRFSRADKNKDGKIEANELLDPRRKAFAKLDANGNGALSFEEWAAKTIGKFQGADANHDGVLTAAEYATTAPPPPKHPSCSCGRSTYAPRASDNSDD